MLIVTGSILANSDNLDEILSLSLEHVSRSRTERGKFSAKKKRDWARMI